MKKNLLASLSTIALISTVASAAFFAKTASATTAAPAQPVDLSRLPAGLVVPAKLPAIQDATLLEAWIRLYNHQDPIRLWDGSSLSGRSLAEYLLDHAIPVVWDTGNVCGNGSCSVKTCSADACTYDDGKPGIAPIYVRAAERPAPGSARGDDMPALVATLAHETFHRTQPFGPVGDTRFEEYWAYRIEYHITAEAWLTFGAYNPLDPNHLNMWLRENRLDPYFQLPEYPASVEPLVVRPQESTGGSFEGLPADAIGNGQGNTK
jgi:hypothetical protein